MLHKEKLDLLLANISLPLPWHTFLWKRLYENLSHDVLPHTLLFHASSNFSSKTFAKAFASLILCEKLVFDEQKKIYLSCKTCKSCQLFLANTHPNYYVLKASKEKESHAKYVTIDQVRSLIISLMHTPNIQTLNHSSYRTVVLIEDVERLHHTASNALLKILEEPGPDTVFLLVTTKPDTLLLTMQSRCQILRLPNPSLEEAQCWLETNFKSYNLEMDEKTSVRISLDLSENDPITALRHFVDGTFDLYRLLLQSLIALEDQKINPGSMAERWNQYPIEKVLYCFVYVLHQLIRWKLGIDPIDCGKDIACEEVEKLLRQKSIFFLFTYLDKLHATQCAINLYTLNTLISFEELAYAFT